MCADMRRRCHGGRCDSVPRAGVVGDCPTSTKQPSSTKSTSGLLGQKRFYGYGLSFLQKRREAFALGERCTLSGKSASSASENDSRKAKPQRACVTVRSTSEVKQRPGKDRGHLPIINVRRLAAPSYQKPHLCRQTTSVSCHLQGGVLRPPTCF